MLSLKAIAAFFLVQRSEEQLADFVRKIPPEVGWIHSIQDQMSRLASKQVILIVLFCPKKARYIDPKIDDSSCFTEVFMGAMAAAIQQWCGYDVLTIDYRKECRRTTQDNHCAQYTMEEYYVYGYATAVEILLARSVYSIDCIHTIGISADVARETSPLNGIQIVTQIVGQHVLGKATRIPFHPAELYSQSRGGLSESMLRGSVVKLLAKLPNNRGSEDEWAASMLSILRAHPKTRTSFTDVINVEYPDLGVSAESLEDMVAMGKETGFKAKVLPKQKLPLPAKTPALPSPPKTPALPSPPKFVPPMQQKTPRRQNQSCDQCRRSKKRCIPIVSEEHSQPQCESCVRLLYKCTFDFANLQLVSKQKPAKSNSSSSHRWKEPATIETFRAQSNDSQ